MNYQENLDEVTERIRITKEIIEQEEKRNKRYERLAYLGFGLGILMIILQII